MSCMSVTQSVAAKLAAYLRHELSLGAPVDWAERAMIADSRLQAGGRFLPALRPPHGNSLCGPGRTKIMEMIRFMVTVEATEDDPGDQPSLHRCLVVD